MAAVSRPNSPASRRPFAALGEARLRAVDSMKNRQNGLRASVVKRPLDVADSCDTENMDPLLMESPTKRQRNRGDIDTWTPKEKTHFAISSLNLSPPTKLSPAPLRTKAVSTTRPAPLRAAAGRSPKSKVAKAFARRGSGFCRVDPPSFPKHHVSSAPFSISDALSGTFTVSSLKMGKAMPSGGKHRRKAWDFEIHVDTEQEEMANLMEHSTCVLDISDDENKSKKDERGKENIPPSDITSELTPANVSSMVASQPETVEMTDGSRSPLGELNLKDFIPNGEDISPAIVNDDEADAVSSESPPAPVTTSFKAGSTMQPPQLLKRAVISSLIKKANVAQEHSKSKGPTAHNEEPSNSTNKSDC
ncbi:hypothetical protein LOZ12_002284 [Ophidiomyces ophidiicola]|uniref:Uncharacterized protein n=1 Tax=Ophidiomyces ophidiicola TaxID=1387563 RepID=A0ACB8V3L1_9EURO|nr:uncharacterized protein LOZ57_000797 [Ophidiomyces ophidiicola]KAI1952717.1 hypothetical protein LOZ57_000797 [Ophidiomyces ophidiicola]KAI1954284.1 hypothetical protein LOZ62_000863 [Ophidiomyces ophidiicola]KAI1975818.1 hypothetical protein LOZ56_000409 [Ophidiomyces ophidiicola]KAI2012046.1 hypothetical protein LOZ50_000367 [Ophidiomyces ophidiicola]KAI2030109.1 hypothetical protein LOZ45_001646 [Ophidiomyces ophidiicola]